MDFEGFVFLSKTFEFYLLSNKKTLEILCEKLSIIITLFVL